VTFSGSGASKGAEEERTGAEATGTEFEATTGDEETGAGEIPRQAGTAKATRPITC